MFELETIGVRKRGTLLQLVTDDDLNKGMLSGMMSRDSTVEDSTVS